MNMDLGICPTGSAVRVRWVDLDDGERARLRELGIREGAVLHVVNCGAFGARVVAIGSDRFAIDGRTCACIAVIPHDDDAAVVGSQDLIRNAPAIVAPAIVPPAAVAPAVVSPKGAPPAGAVANLASDLTTQRS